MTLHPPGVALGPLVLLVRPFLPGAYAVLALDRGLLALWGAFSAFMLARLATLTLRARGSAWLVTGALPRRR